MKVTVEYITIPREGETENGDAVLVRSEGENTLVTVIDALGHGEKAARAATAGVGFLGEVSLARGLRPVVDGLHERLRGTRGAAAMLLLFNQHKLEGCGVGNVALRSYRARVPAMLTPGVLGQQMQRLRFFQGEVAPGDRLILYSDGISSRFDEEGARSVSAIVACRTIMERYRKSHDDATVLVTDIDAATEEGLPSSPMTSRRAP